MKISDYYPVDHEDGSVDERYRVLLNLYLGHPKYDAKPFTVYFCGEFVSTHKTHEEAVTAAREHNRARLQS